MKANLFNKSNISLLSVLRMSRSIKYISDPLYGFIEIDVDIHDGVLLDILDTPEYQRMRYITQTGLSFFTYPTAHHKRFEHCLGVYSLAKEFLGKMPDDEVDKASKEYFLITSLIHDIGHAAFSHDFETMVESIVRRRLPGKNICRHEDWLVKIISDPDTVLHKILYDKHRVGEEIKNLIYSIYREEMKCAREEYIGEARGELTPLIRLLSSELDIDRLDYLLRDSYFTGVASGVYDFERLKRGLVYNSEFKRFVVREKDIPAIEGFFIARYHMYRLVYNHKTTLSAKTLFWKMFLRAWDLYIDGKLGEDHILEPISSLFEHIFIPPVKTYLEIIDPLLVTQIRLWQRHPDNILRDLSSRFMARQLFKPVPVKSSLPPSIIDKIRNIVSKHGYDPEYYYEYVPNTIPRYIQLRYDALPEVYKDVSSGVIIEEHKRDITEVSDIIRSLISPSQLIKGFIMVPTDEVRREVLRIIK